MGDDVDLEGGFIHVGAKKAKSARRRLVKIEPNLHRWLDDAQRAREAVAPLNLRTRLLEARKAAKLRRWPFNGLRHSFASYHLAHFKDAARLALEMGHTNTNMIFGHYRELVRTEEAATILGDRATPFPQVQDCASVLAVKGLRSASMNAQVRP